MIVGQERVKSSYSHYLGDVAASGSDASLSLQYGTPPKTETDKQRQQRENTNSLIAQFVSTNIQDFSIRIVPKILAINENDPFGISCAARNGKPESNPWSSVYTDHPMLIQLGREDSLADLTTRLKSTFGHEKDQHFFQDSVDAMKEDSVDAMKEDSADAMKKLKEEG